MGKKKGKTEEDVQLMTGDFSPPDNSPGEPPFEVADMVQAPDGYILCPGLVKVTTSGEPAFIHATIAIPKGAVGKKGEVKPGLDRALMSKNKKERELAKKGYLMEEVIKEVDRGKTIIFITNEGRKVEVEK